MLQINNKNINSMFFGTDNLTVNKLIFNGQVVWNKITDKYEGRTGILFVGEPNTYYNNYNRSMYPYPLIQVTTDENGEYFYDMTDKVLDKFNYMLQFSNNIYNIKFYNFDTYSVTDMSYMFYNRYRGEQLDVTNFDTSNVTDMSYMFIACSSLTSLDVTNFDTSNVTNMSFMFRNCSSLTSLDLSSFDTSNVTKMYEMFGYCSKLTSLDLRSFDTSNVTTMSNMFYNCSSLTSLNIPINISDSTFRLYSTDLFNGCENLNYIRCKCEFKQQCIKNQDKLGLPDTMREGGSGIWDCIDKMQLVSLSNKNTNLEYDDINPEALLIRDYTYRGSQSSSMNTVYKLANNNIGECNLIQFPVEVTEDTTFTLTIKKGASSTSINNVVYTQSVLVKHYGSLAYRTNVIFQLDEDLNITKYTCFQFDADKKYYRAYCPSSSYTQYDGWMNSTSSPTGQNQTNSAYNTPQIILWKTE